MAATAHPRKLSPQWLSGLRYCTTVLVMLKDAARAVMRRLGVEVHLARPDYAWYPAFHAPNARKLIDFRQERGFAAIAQPILAEGRTSLRDNRLYTLWQAVRNVPDPSLPIAEVGSFRGGSLKFLAAASRQRGSASPIHAFDTFAGFPDTVDPERDPSHAAHIRSAFTETSAASVAAYVADFPNVHLHVGDFAQTCDEVGDLRFALVHVDVDIYASTRHALAFFWPRLVDGGVIVVDDYGFVTCPGARQAVEEFLGSTRGCRFWYLTTGQALLERLCP